MRRLTDIPTLYLETRTEIIKVAKIIGKVKHVSDIYLNATESNITIYNEEDHFGVVFTGSEWGDEEVIQIPYSHFDLEDGEIEMLEAKKYVDAMRQRELDRIEVEKSRSEENKKARKAQYELLKKEFENEESQD